MPKPITIHRLAAFHRQDGCCFYCNVQMWIDDPAIFAAKNGLKLTAVSRFQCTAEHLVARQDGGRNTQDNIVAACRFCNNTRHRVPIPPEPDAYRQHVIRRMRSGRWHPPDIRPSS
ncbi:MAG: HNH endonuclease signature motif containing protein [Gammaproteobacteria bacterium]|nr:HNH endonuclease signature motif containing protein [Gammaproteobacteria bacterium]